MKQSSFFLAAATTVVLAGCGSNPQAPLGLLDNPLYAEWYFDDAVNQVVDLEIADDASLKLPGAKDRADAVRREALSQSQEAVKLQDAGRMGSFVEVLESTQGETLLTHDALFFGPEFLTAPGIDLRVYLSPLVDPRVPDFPGDDDLDIGLLATPYGAQGYRLDMAALGQKDFRSVVLWDTVLKRLHGFAQLRAPITADPQ